MTKNGYARVDRRHPQASAICDRCGFMYNHSDLRFQDRWAGNDIVNTRWLVCSDCYDIPNEQARTIRIPADPLPIMNARPEDWDAGNIDLRVLTDGDVRITEDGSERVTMENGDDMIQEILDHD